MKIAQFTDCHLFADLDARHFSAPVYANLITVLLAIAADDTVDVLVFTGDLTQDHSRQSYHNFVNAIVECGIKQPVYFQAGNHDDRTLMAEVLNNEVLKEAKLIENDHWQIMLCDSKSQTPAGYVENAEFERWQATFKTDKFQLIFMHHHPIPVNYFIDKHGLENQAEFWLEVARYPSIKAIACGHVHNELKLVHNPTGVPLYTCPATSLQFAKERARVSAESITPAYRTFNLLADGQFMSEVVYLDHPLQPRYASKV